MDGAKIYGLCLERLRYQIGNAKSKRDNGVFDVGEKILLESYNTGDREEIADILELYDLEENTPENVKEKLDELSYTVSVLAREALSFGLTPEGHFGLYLTLFPERPPVAAVRRGVPAEHASPSSGEEGLILQKVA